MKRSSLLVTFALALGTAAPAFAQGGSIGLSGTYGDTAASGHSTKTRAEVRAEVAAAQRDGTLAALRKTMSYPQGVELAQRTYRSADDANQLANANQ